MSHSIRHLEAESRFVMTDGTTEIGELTYRQIGDRLVIDHTGIDPKYRGQGLAGELVRHVLDELRERGTRYEPACPYVREFIARNPEYADLAV